MIAREIFVDLDIFDIEKLFFAVFSWFVQEEKKI